MLTNSKKSHFHLSPLKQGLLSFPSSPSKLGISDISPSNSSDIHCDPEIPLSKDPIVPLNIDYDPYKIPADLNLAENHAKARKIGILAEYNVKKSFNHCPCCSLPIEKEPFGLCCKTENFSFLGCAYPFYFFFLKRVLMIIGSILLVSGSLKLLMINYNCGESCVTYFGFGVLNLNDYRNQVFGQSGIDTIFSIMLIILMVFIKSRCFEAIKLYNDNSLSPSSYTLMVRNLPRESKREEIYSYFRELIQKDISKVNMAFDVRDYNDLFKRRLKISSELKGLYYRLQEEGENGVINEVKRLEEEDKRIGEELKGVERDCEEGNKEKFTGTAFVTFRSQTSARILIDQWGVTLLRNLEFLFLRNWAMPYLRFRGHTILVQEAPDPTDLIWENLSFSLWRDLFNYTFLYVLSGLILVFSFYIQFQVVVIVSEMKEELQSEIKHNSDKFNMIVQGAALGVSSITIMINFLLRLTVYFFAYMEKPYSNSRFNQSYIKNYIFLAFFNSALMPYLVNSFVSSNKTSEQLIWDIHFILLCNAFATPISKFFDIMLWIRKLMRLYIRFKGKKCLIPQHHVNYWFESTSMDIAENYAYVTRTLLLAVWYSSVAPLGLIYCLLGLGFNYCIDKYLLLRVNSFPLHQNEEIIYKFINNLEVVSYLYMYGAIEYHSRIVLSENLIEWVWSFVFYGVSSVSLTLCLVIYVLFFKHRSSTKNLSSVSYDDVKYLFVSDYDRRNPITQNQSNRDFVASIKTSIMLSPLLKKSLIRKTAVLLEPNIINSAIGRKTSYWQANFKRNNVKNSLFEMVSLNAGKSKYKRKKKAYEKKFKDFKVKERFYSSEERE